MPGHRTLPAGVTVLLVEDDFYQAQDALAALVAAGAAVLGPCSGAGEALRLMGEAPPDCAVLDVNLGAGPDFILARTLISRGAPVVFLTGYERSVLPADLSPAAVLGKPAAADTLVAAVQAALADRAQI